MRKQLAVTFIVFDVVVEQGGANYAVFVWSRKRGYGAQ
jgi:hypothetical protein